MEQVTFVFDHQYENLTKVNFNFTVHIIKKKRLCSNAKKLLYVKFFTDQEYRKMDQLKTEKEGLQLCFVLENMKK